MLSPRLLAAASLAASGCSILYDADDLRQPPPDAIPIDADPSLLMITGAEPDSVAEGVGDDGGRVALFAIQGDSIAGSATVTATLDPAGAATPVEILESAIDPGSKFVIVAVRIPVMTDLPLDSTRLLRFSVAQPGASSMDADVTVLGLDELTLDSSPKAEAELAALYSRIDVISGIHFTGDEPVQLHATAGITIGGALDVDAEGRTAGPHGCRGGAAEGTGSCGAGGGGGGASSEVLADAGGGGGGGFGIGADTGGGTGGGTGGEETGNDMLVPIRTGTSGAGNRGNGGGGGGNGGLLGTTVGGEGGGGGGVIDVTAGGTITVASGLIRAKGADGTVVSGSGGGGGSGGAILVRAGGGIAGASGAWLEAPGGAGGESSQSNGGSAGSVGRIRIDSPGDVAAMAETPAPIAGPAWDASTPSITRTHMIEVTIHGQPGRTFAMLRGNDIVGDVVLATSSGEITLTLELGVNRVCAAYVASTQSPNLGVPESVSCVEIAFVP